MLKDIIKLPEYDLILSNFDYLEDRGTFLLGSLNQSTFTVTLQNGYLTVHGLNADLITLSKILQNLEKLQTLLTLKSHKVLVEQV